MYTAEMTRDFYNTQNEAILDKRIRETVVEATNKGYTSGTIRVYCDDAFRYTIAEELTNRGFKNIDVPDIIIKGDVYFDWS